MSVWRIKSQAADVIPDTATSKGLRADDVCAVVRCDTSPNWPPGNFVPIHNKEFTFG